MLKVEGLSVFYPDGTRALQNVNLSVENGESIALIGANGAGKTSLILSLVGILPRSAGEVTVDGLPLNEKNMRLIRANVGVVFQNPDDQLFMPTIGEDIAFGLRNNGVSKEEEQRRIEKWLELLDITALRERTALKLSGGEKRMAALATVLVMEPSVMLFDEPTAFLDLRARRKLIGALRGLTQAKLIATHDLSFALETCSRAVLLKDGQVFADGVPRELLFDAALMEECGVEAIGVWEKGGYR